MKLPLLAAALAIAGCMPTNFTETDGVVRITWGGGGDRDMKMKIYSGFYDADQVIVNGPMFSYDGFFAFSAPNSCYTENAELRLHMAKYLGIWPSRKWTEHAASFLPKPIRERFKRDIAYYSPIGFLRIGYEELLELWPEGECKDDVADLHPGVPAPGFPFIGEAVP